MLDLDVEPSSVSSTLIGVVAQRMVRKICKNCRAPYQPTTIELDSYIQEMQEPAEVFFHGAGCNLCANTGYRGRTGIFELLTMSEPVRKLLRGNASAAEIKEQAVSEGMITMKRDGMIKAGNGTTTIGEVLRSVFSIN
ncbi:MAG: hypothetical protein MUO19_08770 [Dehalococcoidales bacterium]|nr:hypothetical protein [Dehalococcoidales bacterium]